MNIKNIREKLRDYFGLYNTIRKNKSLYKYSVIGFLVNSNTKA